MPYIKEDKNFKGRNVQDHPSFVGSLTPLRDFKGFATQSALTVAAGSLGAITKTAAKAPAAIGGKASGVLGAALGGLVAGEVINQTLLDQSLFDVLDNSSAMGPLFFQFFPETISDDRQVDFNEQSLPFFSNPIPTFVSASPRTIGFSLQFAQEMWIPSSTGDKNAMNWTKHNFNVGLAVQAVRSFAYPIIGFVPQPLLLTLPGTQIGIDGDSIFCLLKGYSTQYEAFFPDGQPRLASMNLTFQEFTVGISGQHGNITKGSFGKVYQDYTSYTVRVINNASVGALSEGKLSDVPVPGITRKPDSASVSSVRG